jgi:hypothetical protein
MLKLIIVTPRALDLAWRRLYNSTAPLSTQGDANMLLWLRTFVWTLFFELLGVILAVLIGIGTILGVNSLIEGRLSMVLIIGLLACLLALTFWWRYASKFVSEPDPVLDDPRPFSARLAADMTTTLFGIGIVTLSMVQITTLGESQVRWALLATILGGPFLAMGLGAAWERWNRRTFG